MAKAFYKTELPDGAKWRGLPVVNGGFVEAKIVADNKDGTFDLGVGKEVIVGKCRKGAAPGKFVAVEDAPTKPEPKK